MTISPPAVAPPGGGLDGAVPATGAHGLQLSAFRYEERFALPLHRHPEYVLLCVCSGAAEFVQFGQAETLRLGDAAMANAGTVHGVTFCPDGEPTEGLAIVLDPGELVRYLVLAGTLATAGGRRWRLAGKQNLTTLTPVLESLLAELRQARPHRHALIEAAVSHVVLHLLSRWPRGLLHEQPALPQDLLGYSRFTRALEMMRTSHWSGFSVPVICRELNLSRGRFHELFRNTADQSPHRCFSAMLISRAAGMLADTDKQIKQIACALGFQHVSHFCAVFRRVTGRTPSEFRETRPGLLWTPK